MLRAPLAGQSKMTRFPRPGQSRVHAVSADNGTWQVSIVVIAIASVLGLGLLATDQYLATAKRRAGGAFESANGNAIYSGSILYVPETGDGCHQWQFDNRNGHFNDKGAVNCDDVADHELNGSKDLSSARIRVISDGFRDH